MKQLSLPSLITTFKIHCCEMSSRTKKSKTYGIFSSQKVHLLNPLYFIQVMRLQPEETTALYAARLSEKSTGYEFHNDDERICKQFILTSDKEDLILKVIFKTVVPTPNL